MSEAAAAQPLGFWRTFRLMLGAARLRAKGRRKRARQILRRGRKQRLNFDWSLFGTLLVILMAAAVHLGAVLSIWMGNNLAGKIDAERDGRIVVSGVFLRDMGNGPPSVDVLQREAARQAKQRLVEVGDFERTLKTQYDKAGAAGFIAANKVESGLRALPLAGRLPGMVGSLVLIWWLITLAIQSEGMELDFQRRHHPMWEWLMSHPVRPSAVFFSEMLLPALSNPILFCAPLFPAVLYGLVYGLGKGVLAGLLIGVPAALAGSCVGKGLEIAIMLRFPQRIRGALIGVMGWLNYTSSILLLLSTVIVMKLLPIFGQTLQGLASLPWPWLGLFLGQTGEGEFSFAIGVARCAAGALLVGAAALTFAAWGANRGLTSPSLSSRPARNPSAGGWSAANPLYRKEFLWFRRDPSAVVQSILVPLTLGGIQLLNFSKLIHDAARSGMGWNAISGAAVLMGTYFIVALGPKSLASEGAALWIAMSWPQGLEALLKAKARLWSMIATLVVWAVLAVAAWRFPDQIIPILVVAVAWMPFARTMAEKSVTLVSVPSESGEAPRQPRGRAAASQLGMLTFAIGVFGQNWPLAFTGLVYSWLTSAAMWQNLRQRLPYLYDPWSEPRPLAPSLMHAMIGISTMVEIGAVGAGFVQVAKGVMSGWTPLLFGLSGLLVSIGMLRFLDGRGAPLTSIIRWEGRLKQLPFWCLGAIAGGGILGLLAGRYQALLRLIPWTAEMLQKAEAQPANPGLHLSLAVVAIGFAPFTEEFMFRGLLYRALDREWSGWKAVSGSALFFAIYHPPLAWLPVAVVGAANALLFKKSGWLLPCVLLHMTYNAVLFLIH